jgi:hypothetical protein
MQGGSWNSYDGMDPQVPIAASKWGFGHPDTTRFINCDVYNLCDTLSSEPGNAADGWKTVHYDGNYTEWDGCRAWNYTDDGIDPNNISGGKRVIKNCWATPGWEYTSVGGWAIERNAFKLSGMTTERAFLWDSTKVYLEVHNNIAFGANQGFVQLGYLLTTNTAMFNNTAYHNGISYVGGYTDGYPMKSEFRNNISYDPTANNPGTGTPYHVSISSVPYPQSNNTWTYQESYPNYTDNPALTVSSDSFLNTDTIAVFNNLTAPRKADGSLPDITTLSLAEGSDLIDGGIDVGLPYNGTAPDLGAFEYGDEPGEAITTIAELEAAIDAANSGDVLEVSSNTMIGTITIDKDNITITAAIGYTPIFSNSMTVSCSNLTLTDLTFATEMVINQAEGLDIHDCTFTTSGSIYTIVLQSSDYLLGDITMERNTLHFLGTTITYNNFVYDVSRFRTTFTNLNKVIYAL